eukprot:12211611-Alexandrium_andersonii.AAC.1
MCIRDRKEAAVPLGGLCGQARPHRLGRVDRLAIVVGLLREVRAAGLAPGPDGRLAPGPDSRFAEVGWGARSVAAYPP